MRRCKAIWSKLRGNGTEVWNRARYVIALKVPPYVAIKIFTSRIPTIIKHTERIRFGRLYNTRLQGEWWQQRCCLPLWSPSSFYSLPNLSYYSKTLPCYLYFLLLPPSFLCPFTQADSKPSLSLSLDLSLPFAVLKLSVAFPFPGKKIYWSEAMHSSFSLQIS